MGKTSGSKQLAAASGDEFATDPKPLTPVMACKKGKTLLKVHLLRIDTDAAIDNETVTATKGKAALTKTTAAVTGIADYGTIDPGSYTFTVTLSTRRRRMFKPYAPHSAGIPKQVDFHATLKLEPLAKLRIVLFDKANRPIRGATWRMTQPVGGNGTTGNDGKIEVDVPWASATGDLVVKLPDITDKEPAPGPAPVVDANNPAYPLGIDAAQFLPAEDAYVLMRDVNWTYEIDIITDSDDADGWKGRLNNVGFPIDDDPRVTRSVKAFQRWHKKQYAGSGTLADISGDLKTLHDPV